VLETVRREPERISVALIDLMVWVRPCLYISFRRPASVCLVVESAVTVVSCVLPLGGLRMLVGSTSPGALAFPFLDYM
jgi:hypothetical protein